MPTILFDYLSMAHQRKKHSVNHFLPNQNYHAMGKLGYMHSIAFFVTTLFSCTACNKPPYKADFKNVKGYVIGKETCNANGTGDYWLVDLTYLPDTPQYGDTIIFNGGTYTNVIKTKGLDERLKEVGIRVSLDYKVITPSKVATTSCNAANPITYTLKELFIINQGEIR